MRSVLCIGIMVWAVGGAFARETAKEPIRTVTQAARPLPGHGYHSRPGFEENKGQWPKRIRFASRLPGMDAGLCDGGIELVLAGSGQQREDDAKPGVGLLERARGSSVAVARLEWEGALSEEVVEGMEEPMRQVSYWVGADTNGWIHKARVFPAVRRENVYPGIDVIVRGSERGELRHDFVVEPGADPNQIRWRVRWTDRMGRPMEAKQAIDDAGQVRIWAAGEELTMREPVVYQEGADGRERIEAAFELGTDGSIRLALGHYDRGREVVIDPAVIYSSYFGGLDPDFLTGVAVDASDLTFVTGYTVSPDFPVDDYGFIAPSDTNAVLMILPPVEFYLTEVYVVGGNGADAAASIHVADDGLILIGGLTDSQEIPLGLGGGGGFDAAVFGVEPDRSALRFWQRIGGAALDVFRGVDVTSDGQPIAVGFTDSLDFPATVNPGMNGGGTDGMLVLFDTLGGIVSSATIGYSGYDAIFGVVAGSGSVFVCGESQSPDFFGSVDVSTGAAFMLKFDNALGYLTGRYIDGNGTEFGRGIGLSGDESEVYLGGISDSGDITGVSTPHAGGYDGYLWVLDAATGVGLTFGFIGSDGSDGFNALTVLPSGEVALAGFSFSSTLPTFSSTLYDFPGDLDGLGDGFVAVVDPFNYFFRFGTFFGGDGYDEVNGVAATSTGRLSFAGATESTALYYANAYQQEPAFDIFPEFFGSDGFIVQLATSDLPSLEVLGGYPIFVPNQLPFPDYDNGTLIDVVLEQESGFFVYLLYNNGSIPLTVNSVSLDDVSGQFTPVLSATEIQPFDFEVLAILLEPDTVGFYETTVTIDSNDPDKPVYQFPIGAFVFSIFDEDFAADPDEFPEFADLEVNLLPPDAVAAGGQWRISGTETWRGSGEKEMAVTSGRRSIELRSVFGYAAPLEPVSVEIRPGLNRIVLSYTNISGTVLPGSGDLTVQLEPAGAVNAGAGWRVLGEGTFRGSGSVAMNLAGGRQTVEYAGVPGYLAPPARNVLVFGGELTEFFGRYVDAAQIAPLEKPRALSAVEVTNTPYALCGLVQTDSGQGSGVVVSKRAVLTAASVVFNDVYLGYETGVRWFHQQHDGLVRPTGLEPIGWTVFAGYAAQRAAQQTNGSLPGDISDLESQNANLAALFFGTNAARGASAGLGVSDALDHEILVAGGPSLIAGYPSQLFGSPTNRGQMHATAAAQRSFVRWQGAALDALGNTNRVYAVGGVFADEGFAGAPIFMEHGGSNVVAAVHLGFDAGTGQALVRGIDSDAALLVREGLFRGFGITNRNAFAARRDFSAELSGGVVGVTPGTGMGMGGFFSGGLRVRIEPAAAGAAGAAWRVGNDMTWRDSGTDVRGLAVGDYSVVFRAANGFQTPAARSVSIAANQTEVIAVTYSPGGNNGGGSSGGGGGDSDPNTGILVSQSSNNRRYRVGATADVDGDGDLDLIRYKGPRLEIALMNGTEIDDSDILSDDRVDNKGWKVVGAVDVNQDQVPDIIRQRRAEVHAVLMDSNLSIVDTVDLDLDGADPRWKVIGAGDFTGDGRRDLVRTRRGLIEVWPLVGTEGADPIELDDLDDVRGWKPAGVGTIDGSGLPQIVRKRRKTVDAVLVNSNLAVIDTEIIKSNVGKFKVAGVGDLDQDGYADILLQKGAEIRALLMTNGVQTRAGTRSLRHIDLASLEGFAESPSLERQKQVLAMFGARKAELAEQVRTESARRRSVMRGVVWDEKTRRERGGIQAAAGFRTETLRLAPGRALRNGSGSASLAAGKALGP